MSTDEQEIANALGSGRVCSIAISYHEGEPTIVGIFPNCCGEDYAQRARQLFAIAHGLAEQSYKNLEAYQKEVQADGQEKSKHDPNIA